MWQALKKFWPLVGLVMLVAAVALGLYAWNFQGLGLSDDPGSWASFANYASGTVGVVILGATLIAFIVTLNQQSKLLQQQDIMINNQATQVIEVERHQRKIEAYSRAEKLFPTLLRNARGKLDVSKPIMLSQ